MVGEKETENIEKENTAVIYGGYGYGVGMIIGNKLHTEGGQLGHMSVLPVKTISGKKDEDMKEHVTLCRCGQVNCLENRINTDVFGKVTGNEISLKFKSSEELAKILEDDATKKLIFSEYLSQAIYNITQIVGINNIILTGKLSKLYTCVSKELKNALISKNMTSQIITKSELGEFSAAVGVAIQAYYEKYKIPYEWKY